MNWDADPRFRNGSRRGAPDRSVRRHCRRCRRERRFGEVLGRRRRRALRPHVRPRAAADRDRRPLRPQRPSSFRTRRSSTARSRARLAPVSASSSPSTPIRPVSSRRASARPRSSRRTSACSPHLPAGAAVRHRQRAEPAGVLAAAVRRRRQQLSAPAFAPYLAAAYDTLKAVDPEHLGASGSGCRRAATTGRPPATTSRPRPCASCARSAPGTAGAGGRSR